jgi:hypothetical protein
MLDRPYLVGKGRKKKTVFTIKVKLQFGLCFGRHVKPFVPAAFAVISSHLFGPGLLWVMARFPYVIHKEGPCPNIADINRLMMMMTNVMVMFFQYYIKYT